MSYGIMCNLCNDDILHDPTTIRQHVVTFHLDALPAAAPPPPPPPTVDDHDDSYGLVWTSFSAHVVAPLDDVADCGSCFSCFC
ncbi:hypothetical protein Tco_1139175 [Tanacetum coccineum]